MPPACMVPPWRAEAEEVVFSFSIDPILRLAKVGGTAACGLHPPCSGRGRVLAAGTCCMPCRPACCCCCCLKPAACLAASLARRHRTCCGPVPIRLTFPSAIGPTAHGRLCACACMQAYDCPDVFALCEQALLEEPMFKLAILMSPVRWLLLFDGECSTRLPCPPACPTDRPPASQPASPPRPAQPGSQPAQRPIGPQRTPGAVAPGL